MGELHDARGILYPARLPSFHREPAPEELREVIRWFWIPRWNLPAGRLVRQELLPFPASNLVVQQDGVILSGPTTGASHRDLRGHGWAVGALLRPGGIAALHPEPWRIRNIDVPFDATELHYAVSTGMSLDDTSSGRDRAVRAYVEWLTMHLRPTDEAALLANRMEDVISSDRTIVRVEQVAAQMGISIRALQRLARRYVGVPPLSLIRQYRLQEAAQRMREEPTLTITEIAVDLGYADHAHLTNDFRRVLGFTPHSYRRNPVHTS